MNAQPVQRVVDAVLYEGYLLYPYRPSSLKNRQRWTFGGVYPRAYSEAQRGTDPCEMQTECLLEGTVQTRVEVRVGFLHLVERRPAELAIPLRDWPASAEPELRMRDALDLGCKRYVAWQEATERHVEPPPYELRELLDGGRSTAFAFAARRELEPLRDERGDVAGVLVREQSRIEGMVEMRASALPDGAFRVTVRIVNTTPIDAAPALDRERASLHALVSCHTILQSSAGAFVSLMDPPPQLRQAAAACRNVGTWPVLAGDAGQRELMLSSPIILYDYPEVAAESPGDFFDSTEIDEMLALRILTMTDDEKREMAAADERGRLLLERTEALTATQLRQLHGAVRGLRPVPGGEAAPEPPRGPWEPFDALPRLASLTVGGVELTVGDPVRLAPRGSADIMDIALAGKLATIESIERDFENRVHVAVTVDDDPGRDLGTERMPGHRFFFSPEEIVPLREARA